MSNIGKAFEKGKAFIVFITCGDPDLETTAAAVRAAAQNGASLIELGIPFSDPVAESPVIQESAFRALKAGITSDRIFAFVKELRRDITIPMIFVTYSNVVFSYGADSFMAACREAGIDGLMLQDLPYEERGEFLESGQRHGVDLISMATPASEDRLDMIAGKAEGFLYIVAGGCNDFVSGAAEGEEGRRYLQLEEIVRAIKKNACIPCAVDSHISTVEQARKTARTADGIIVGSPVVKLLERYGRNAPGYIGEYVGALTAALNGQ